MRKMGKAMLTIAWKVVSQTAHTQFTPKRRPYQEREPDATWGRVGSKNVISARPSSMIPYAAPIMRIPGQPVFHRKESSRTTRTPVPYSHRFRRSWIGLSHARGGVDPVIASGRNAARKTNDGRRRRVGGGGEGG